MVSGGVEPQDVEGFINMTARFQEDEEKFKLLDSARGSSKSFLFLPKGISLVSSVAVVSYGMSSWAMVFLNKAVLQQYSYSMTLLTLQQVATAFLMLVGGKLGVLAVRNIDLETSRNLLPLSFFYNANVAFALASLRGINVPMYIALKRLTPLTVLVIGFFRGTARPSRNVTLSIMIVTLGVIIAAAGDFSFDPMGYAMALLSVSFQTAYLVLVEKSGADYGMSSTDLMLFNSVLSLPFLAAYMIGSGELSVSTPELKAKMASGSFSFVVMLSIVFGMVLNFTMFLCTTTNSALTTTIVGVFKGVGSTILGFVLLGGVEVHAVNVTGLVINTVGAMLYTFFKYKEKVTRKQLTLPLESKHLS